MSKLNLPCYWEMNKDNIILVYELTIPISTSEKLSGTDCPAEKCSACGELFEEGSKFCSSCGRLVIRND